MKVTFQIAALRKANSKETSIFKEKYKNSSWEYDRIMKGEKEYPDTHRLAFELNSFKGDDIHAIHEFAKRLNVDTRTLNSIERWIVAISNPKDATVPSVAALKQMLVSIMNENKYKWIMRESPDGFLLPYLVYDIRYNPPSKFSAESTDVELVCATYYDSEEYSGNDKASKESERVSFHSSDLFEDKQDDDSDTPFDINNMYDFDDIDESEDDDDDNDDKPVVKKSKQKLKVPPKRKKIFKKLMQILADRNIFMPTDESLDKFFEHARLCYELSHKLGEQYICTGKAYMKEGWSTRVHPMSDEGRPYRLVIDMKGIPEDAERQHKAYIGYGLIPFHPYVRCYNLTKYSFCDVHAGLLQPYQYNDRIVDNMVADDSLKNYLNSIIGGKNVFVDIVEGKSGGMIILASGMSGVGKTLTAEVYSEKMHLPLYQIQASQLGIDVESIEKRLIAALKRTERWGAVLLIDECDTYLRKRANDLEQNAIVGIWLRLLEYFNGIMFLTTNLHDEIDDAILSRCSSHIKYEAPTKEQLVQIIKIHCKLQDIQVTDAVAKSIADKYKMTGRDVRNMLKNIKKCFSTPKGQIVLKLDMINGLKDFIPFIND